MDAQTVLQWIILGVVVAFIAFDKAGKWFATKNGKGVKTQTAYKYNPHPPGASPTCIKHGERLATLEEAVENMEKQLVRIENKLNGAR